MSLPPNPQARYSLPTTAHPPRKSVFKCLPEIHASRLAVSGSLRPKLGLLLLMVVILVSLCFLLIPLLSKINLSQSKSPRIHNLPLIDVFEELNQKASSTVLFSPRIILSSLALLSRSSRPGVCEVLQNNTSSIRMAGRVFTGRDVANNVQSCPVNEIVKVRGKSLVDEWLKEDSFRDTHKNIHFENMPVDKNVVITISSVKLRPSSPVKSILKDRVGPSGSMKPLKFTQIEGQVRMATFPTYTLVLLDMFQDNLELCLLLPHSKSEHLGHISWEDFSLSEYGRTQAEILLPDLSLVSNLSLTEPLSALSKLPADTIVYQHSSLLLLPEAATGDNIMSNIEGGVIRLVFDHSFVLMVREVGMESPLMVGRVIFPR